MRHAEPVVLRQRGLGFRVPLRLLLESRQAVTAAEVVDGALVLHFVFGRCRFHRFVAGRALCHAGIPFRSVCIPDMRAASVATSSTLRLVLYPFYAILGAGFSGMRIAPRLRGERQENAPGSLRCRHTCAQD